MPNPDFDAATGNLALKLLFLLECGLGVLLIRSCLRAVCQSCLVVGR
jgi:hypothetical protein